jgi:hypothetical protein
MANYAAAYGIYSGGVEIADVVRVLNGAGFDNEAICLMLAPTHPMAGTIRDANVMDEASAGGVIGWLSGFGAVVIPSVGFFIRSRDYLQALFAAWNAPPVGNQRSTLAGLGFSEFDAGRLESQLSHSGFLVYVATHENARVHWALELLRHTGAEESSTIERCAGAAA